MPPSDIVLLHGALGAESQFDPFMAALSQRFALHRFNFEGHGPQPDSGRPFRIDYFVENLIAALDHLKLEKANIFGYSMGGYVALALAAREPTRLGRIATLGTKFLWTTDYAAQEAGKLDPDVIEAKVPRFASALEARHTGSGWRTVLAKTAEMMEALGRENMLTLEALGRIENPVRVMLGDRDVTVGRDEAEQVCRALPHGALAVLDDTPHPLESAPEQAILDACAWLQGG